MAGTGRVQVLSKTPIGYNQYDVTISFDIAFDWGGWNSGAYYTIYCNGQSSSGNASFSISSGGGSWVWGHIASHTFRITMPTSGKSLPISFSAGINTGVNPSYIDAYGSDTLSARTWQWTVSYNANGGTGAPSSQTKTYGQTLKLSTTKPTKKDYNFLGWGTSTESTTIEYEAGANYTNNAAITLYAIWELAYVPPRITDVHIDRCDSNGVLADDGRYVKIEFKWASDYPFENYTVFYKKHNSDDDWTGIIGNVYSPEPIYSGSVAKKFDELFAEFEYDIKLSVTDTNGYSEIIRRLPPMSFIIDILKGGKGIAFGRPATLENTFEVDFDAKFDKSIVDKFGEEIQNGLAPNINTTTEDPNTTLKQLIVTNKNTPTGQYMYIETRFFDTKSLTANRSQTAYPYSVEGSSYHRFYYGGSWSPWNRITNASELGTKSMTVMFPSGGTDISGANIINCTILSHDSSDGYLKQSGGGIAIGEGVSSVLVSASVFGWCQKIASTGYFWNRISRFRGTAETEICATITPLNASLYASTIFSPILIQVQAGDVLKLKKMNTENIRIRGLGNTYLTVQVAELE